MEPRRTRILVVDDKADIRRLLVTRLKLDRSLEVVGEAGNGAEAISRVRELKPEAVVLDLQMPVMSGEEAIPILRSLSPATRIVVFSAYVGVQTHLEGSERPDAEVAKGTDLRLLVEELHRVVAAPLDDVVEVDLGQVEVSPAAAACDRWVQLNPRIRAGTPDSGMADLLALVGVFLKLRDQLGEALVEGETHAVLRFDTRREAASGARRALGAIESDDSAALEPLRPRLLEALANVSLPGADGS
ncbi:MAG: response regulator [Candidatus Dormibacteraeota bacterium]|nr:response regulator [Candidatus Dormibacteraeota bacterium]